MARMGFQAATDMAEHILMYAMDARRIANVEAERPVGEFLDEPEVPGLEDFRRLQHAVTRLTHFCQYLDGALREAGAAADDDDDYDDGSVVA